MAADPAEIPLWAGQAPGALGTGAGDIPTLTPFLPDPHVATGAAMVVFPGGGYEMLAAHEGKGYAHWLNAHGVAAFVLKYRLGSAGYRHPVMLEDAARAVRTVRGRAGEWHVDPQRIGIIGSSAGGHLAATLLTHFDQGRPDSPDPVERQGSRPALGVLCYAVISMEAPATHGGSKRHLLGPSPAPALAEALSAEKQVTADTPPCFLWSTREDPMVNVSNSLDFARALQRHGVPFELHVFQKGGHGIGLGGKDPQDAAGLHPWTRECIRWLQEQHFARRRARSLLARFLGTTRFETGLLAARFTCEMLSAR